MDTAAIVHLELHTGDLPAARALYAATCGWHGPTGPVGDGPTVGIVAVRAATSLWLPYVRVPSVDAATAAAAALGADVLVPPGDGPRGRRSVVSTHSGAQVAFWQPPR